MQAIAHSIGARFVGIALLVAMGLATMPEKLSALAPTGVWLDHTGRGAVEIRDCDGALCGQIVWLKEALPGQTCGLEIIGNVQSVEAGRWDMGWILDPEYGDKFDVEIIPLSSDELQVTGYMGVKTLSETMIWKRAPADLAGCDGATQREVVASK